MNCLGFDVSHENGTVDWLQAAQGYQFAMVKASEGVTVTDSQLTNNLPNALAQGIKTGVYHFFRPNDDLRDQLQNFMNSIKGLPDPDFVAVDFELCTPKAGGPEQWGQLIPVDRYTSIRQFLQLIQIKMGIEPIYYMGKSLADLLPTDFDLSAWPNWLAEYAPIPIKIHGFSPWSFWQFSQSGKVNGIKGNVDLSYFNGNIDVLNSFLAGLKGK